MPPLLITANATITAIANEQQVSEPGQQLHNQLKHIKSRNITNDGNCSDNLKTIAATKVTGIENDPTYDNGSLVFSFA